MSSPQTAGAGRSSLARDWLYALRFWLGARRSLLVLLAVVIVAGGALNWSWLVAAGIAPLLLTALPCVAMCGLGLCMHRMTGGSGSTSANGSEAAGAAKPTAAEAAAASRLVAGGQSLPTTQAASPPPSSTIDAVEATAVQRSHIQKGRE